MNNNEAFARWFRQATGHRPYPFQVRFACEPELPELVEVPTGLGKTAMAVLGWLWRRGLGKRLVGVAVEVVAIWRDGQYEPSHV